MAQNLQADAAVQPLGLLAHSRLPGALESIAIAGAIETAHEHGASPLLRGLDEAEFAALLDTLFPGARAAKALSVARGQAVADEDLDVEFDDLLALLMAAAVRPGPGARWLACAVASAALYDNHLWQDLRLPERRALSELLAANFPALAARNTGNMRWKAFFYKQLCDQAGMVCRSPSCGACDDYHECFGPE
ncbi:MAG: nitrogen fixation protein NifQ [Pseudomonadota bacterium]